MSPIIPLKGRGAVSNLQGRFEVQLRERFDDGWAHEDEELPPFRTQVTHETAKSILSHNVSPDIPFGASINPYRGCEHGCIYCFARPTHAYLGLSPGLDFESKLTAKVNAPELLREALSRPGYVPEPISIGINTDAYQPVERELRITRRLLELLHASDHPVALITKSSLVERDIDLLAPMAAKRQAIVAITLTTLDTGIARTLEPRATTPLRRLRTIRTLTDAGIPVGVSIAPVIPFVTEPDLERILEACAEAGAVSAHYVVLRLPHEVNPLFQQWLQAHFPERAARVMNRVREIHGGKDYDATFGKRMTGSGVWADLIAQRFRKAIDRLGLASEHRMRVGQLEVSRFRPPPRCEGQLALF